MVAAYKRLYVIVMSHNAMSMMKPMQVNVHVCDPSS